MNKARLLSGALALLPFALRTRMHRIPGLAPLQRRIVAWLGHGRSFEHRITAGPAAGLMLRVTLPDDKLYWAGHWEADVTRALAGEVWPGVICYDIGSHRGFMAGVLALNGASTVHCFEPNPANVAQIKDLQALNPELSITLHRCAIGAVDGRVEFEVMPDPAMGKLANSEFQHGSAGDERLTVDLRRIDSLVGADEVPPADLIKIDIEGAEFDALRGAEGLINMRKPVLLIEVHTHKLFETCADWLRTRGYVLNVVEQPIGTVSASTFRVSHLLARPGA